MNFLGRYFFEQGTRYNGILLSGAFRFCQLFNFISCLENTFSEYNDRQHAHEVAAAEEGHGAQKAGCCARLPLPKVNSYQVFLFLLFWRLVVFINMCSAMFMAIEMPCGTFQEKGCGALWHNFSACIYFTVCTVSTVGYGDISPKTEVGRYTVSVVILFTIAILPGWLERMVEASADEKKRQKRLAAALAASGQHGGGKDGNGDQSQELQPLHEMRYAGVLRRRFSSQQLSWAAFALGLGGGGAPGDGAAAAAALAREVVAAAVDDAGGGGGRARDSSTVSLYHPSATFNTVARAHHQANAGLAGRDGLADHDDHHVLAHCPDKHGDPSSWKQQQHPSSGPKV